MNEAKLEELMRRVDNYADAMLDNSPKWSDLPVDHAAARAAVEACARELAGAAITRADLRRLVDEVYRRAIWSSPLSDVELEAVLDEALPQMKEK